MDSAIAHQRRQPLALQRLPSYVRIEEPHLRNRCRAHESGLLVELRANFHAAAARNAARERVDGFLLLHGHAWTGTEVVSTVHWHPGLYTLEIFEQYTAISGQVANYRKFRERLEPDRLFEFVHQRGAGHACLAIDKHGARPANFFKTIGLVSNGCGRLAFTGNGVAGDLHHRGDHVHPWMPGKFELLPARLVVGRGLSANFEEDFLVRHFGRARVLNNANPNYTMSFRTASAVRYLLFGLELQHTPILFNRTSPIPCRWPTAPFQYHEASTASQFDG